MAKSRSQELAEAGFELDPVTGASGAQMESPRRPKEKVFHRYYPGQGQLLQDYRKVKAANMLPELEDAVQSVIGSDFEEVFGFSRRPLGVTTDPFLQLQVKPEMPLGHSWIFPEFEDPEKTEVFYNKLRAVKSGPKYMANRAEIDLAYNEMKQLGGNYRMKMQLGLGAGPGYHSATVEQAFRHAILLEGMATLPDNADMGSARRQAQTEATRSQQLMRRHSQLGLLRARGVPVTAAPPGPLLGSAIQMYIDYLGPSLGFRKGRGPEGMFLTPTLAGMTPLTETARKKAQANVRDLEVQDIKKISSEEFRQATPQQRLERLGNYIANTYPVEFVERMNRELGSEFRRMPPERRFKGLLKELHARTAPPEIREASKMMQNSHVLDAIRAIGGGEESKHRVGKQRLTGVVREAGLMTEAQANKVRQKVQRRMGLKPKNTAMVMAIAAILSAGFLVGGLQEEPA
jgi:hypothetical protein